MIRYYPFVSLLIGLGFVASSLGELKAGFTYRIEPVGSTTVTTGGTIAFDIYLDATSPDDEPSSDFRTTGLFSYGVTVISTIPTRLDILDTNTDIIVSNAFSTPSIVIVDEVGGASVDVFDESSIPAIPVSASLFLGSFTFTAGSEVGPVTVSTEDNAVTFLEANLDLLTINSTSISVNVTASEVSAVPEPSTLLGAMLMAGIMVGYRRIRQQ